MKQSFFQLIVVVIVAAGIILGTILGTATGMSARRNGNTVTVQCAPDFSDNAIAAINYAYITGGVSRFIIGGEIVYCFGRINDDAVTCYGTNTGN